MRTIRDGIHTGYTDEGQGPPLVFLHGFPLNRDVWAKQVRAFCEQWRVIAPDLRGFGESDPTPGPVSMDRFAGEVHALLQELEAEPAILVGHSMGGYVALAFARAFPAALRGLVLVGTRAGADTPEGAASRRTQARQVKEEGTATLLASMAPKMLSAANADATRVLSVGSFMRPNPPEGIIGALLGMAERPDAGAWVGAIRLPTLVVAGEDDALIPPSEAGALARAIPGAELQLIPHAGHLVAYEQPQPFNEALQQWLGRTFAA